MYGTPSPVRSGHHADAARAVVRVHVCVFEEIAMKKNLLVLAALAVMLAGCVVVPGRPLYVRAPGVVVY